MGRFLYTSGLGCRGRPRRLPRMVTIAMNHSPALTRRVCTCLAPAAVALVVTIGCQPKNTYVPPPPPKVTIAHPVEKEVVDAAEYTGNTEAYEFVEIRARVEGFLETVMFEPGTNVTADDQLYVIDPKPFQAAVDDAKASVALAKAQVASAKADVLEAEAKARNAEAQYRRGYMAAQGGAVTEAELDDLRTLRDVAVTQIDVAKAKVTSAEASVESAAALLRDAELNLGYTAVTTPIDGRVGRTLVDEGNLVGDGEPTHLTTVVRYNPIYAVFNISEHDLLDFMQQSRERAQPDTSLHETAMKRVVELGLANEDGYPHQGHFEYADLGIDEGTGTYLVRAQFENADRVIVPGAFVRLRLPLEKIQATLIPEEAVGRDQSGTYALVVDSKHIVARRAIELGNKYEGMRAVKKGLSPDDWVVVSGIQRATPGTEVSPEMADDGAQAQPVPAAGDAGPAAPPSE